MVVEQQHMYEQCLTRLAQAGPDVVLLHGIPFDAVNGRMEDVIVHICQCADGVKQQLGAVLALDGHQPVAVHAAVRNAHIWPAVLWGPACAQSAWDWSSTHVPSLAKQSRASMV